MDKYDVPWEEKRVYKIGLPSFPWEGVRKYDGLWEVNMFIKWVYHLFPGRVCTNTMGMVKFYKMRRSNLCVLGSLFCAVVGSLTIVALQPRFLLHTWVCMGLSHYNEPFMV